MSDSVPYETQSRPQINPGSAIYGDNSALPARDLSVASANASKRKSAEEAPGGTKQTRSKRNRYISIACDECKRRKIKCNGETPCQRCGNLNLACLYAPNCCTNNFKDSDEFKKVTTQLSRLQEEVEWLSQTIRSMQNETRPASLVVDRITASGSTIAPSPSQSSASGQRLNFHGKQAQFQGTTSTAFGLDVARDTIDGMGWKATDERDDNEPQLHDQIPASMSNGPFDPLFGYDEDEMVRLCQVHSDEIGKMYPLVSMQSIISHAKNLSPYLRSQRLMESINDEKTLQLKAVMCCALVVEGHGHCEKAVQLYRSMEDIVNRKLMSDDADLSNLPLLALVGGYRYLSNEEVLSWRVMGQVVRLCMELGIHQKRGLMAIQDESERKHAVINFWTAYVLDRRWAFGTGLPYVIRDDEIDPALPMPDEYPLLVSMIAYSRIGAKVWRHVNQFGTVLARELQQEEISRLDEEIIQWYESIPEEIKLRNWDKDAFTAPALSESVQSLKIWTYLRFNQVRTWLHTPVLHNAASISSHQLQAERVVEFAKDTIRYLHHLNSTTDVYRRRQLFYHQFLSAAISVVFLASVNAPMQFSAVCRKEFYLALELVKDLSAKSRVSQRLWRTIKSLKDVAPQFGLNPNNDPHSNAALGMIGLARGHMDPTSTSMGQSTFHNNLPMLPSQKMQDSSVYNNGQRIQSELSRIFEGYVSLTEFQYASNGDEQHIQPPTDFYTPVDGIVFSQMREML